MPREHHSGHRVRMSTPTYLAVPPRFSADIHSILSPTEVAVEVHG